MTLILAGLGLLTMGLVGTGVGRRYGLAKGVAAGIGTLFAGAVMWVLIMAFALQKMG